MDLICGRPKQLVIDALHEHGGKVRRVALKFGMSSTTLYDAIARDLDLQAEVKKAQKYAMRDRVEKSNDYLEELIDAKQDPVHAWKSAHYYLSNYDSEGNEKERKELKEEEKVDEFIDKLGKYVDERTTQP